MTFALILIGIGALFSIMAVTGWRHRRAEMVSIAEAIILKTTGAEPLPLTRFDRALQIFQLAMMSVFGPVLLLLGVAFLLLEFGIIE